MKTVTLRPARARLKQLIRAFGPEWVEVERRPVACFNNKPGVLIRSLDGTHERWVLPVEVN